MRTTTLEEDSTKLQEAVEQLLEKCRSVALLSTDLMLRIQMHEVGRRKIPWTGFEVVGEDPADLPASVHGCRCERVRPSHSSLEQDIFSRIAEVRGLAGSLKVPPSPLPPNLEASALVMCDLVRKQIEELRARIAPLTFQSPPADGAATKNAPVRVPAHVLQGLGSKPGEPIYFVQNKDGSFRIMSEAQVKYEVAGPGPTGTGKHVDYLRKQLSGFVAKDNTIRLPEFVTEGLGIEPGQLVYFVRDKAGGFRITSEAEMKEALGDDDDPLSKLVGPNASLRYVRHEPSGDRQVFGEARTKEQKILALASRLPAAVHVQKISPLTSEALDTVLINEDNGKVVIKRGDVERAAWEIWPDAVVISVGGDVDERVHVYFEGRE